MASCCARPVWAGIVQPRGHRGATTARSLAPSQTRLHSPRSFAQASPQPPLASTSRRPPPPNLRQSRRRGFRTSSPTFHSSLLSLSPAEWDKPALVAAGVAIGATALAVMSSVSQNDPRAASEATRRGMELFRNADVEGSVVEFDRAKELDPRQIPYLWQRGLSLYYLGRYREAAEQFRADVAVNPNDTEEAIWCYLAEALESSPEEARRKFLQVGRDSRPIMRAAYELFRTGQPGPSQLALLAERAEGSGSEFYGYLYVGLFYEAERNVEKAKEYILKSTRTQYAWTSGDYMAALAKVHATVRGWEM